MQQKIVSHEIKDPMELPSLLGFSTPLQKIEYQIEGRSIYFTHEGQQFILKMRTSDDKDKTDFLDGAVITFAYHNHYHAITREYGHATYLKLSKKLTLTLEEQIKEKNSKFSHMSLTSEACLWTHSDYFSYLLKEPTPTQLQQPPAKQMENFESFLEKLKVNIHDYAQLAHQGLFFNGIGSYSHDRREDRDYDHAVFLDLMDALIHGEGVIDDLKEGLLDANFSEKGIRDLGNLLKIKFMEKRYDKDHNQLFYSLSSNKQSHTLFMNYPRTLIEHMSVSYKAILVYLQMNETVQKNLDETSFFNYIFQFLIEPFYQEHLEKYSVLHLKEHLIYVMRPLIKKDWELFSQYPLTLYHVITKSLARDFVLQNFYAGISHFVSIQALLELNISLDIKDPAYAPQYPLSPFEEFQKKRDHTRLFLRELILQEDTPQLFLHAKEFKEESIYLTEYFFTLQENGTQTLLYMLQLFEENLHDFYGDHHIEWINHFFKNISFWGQQSVFEKMFPLWKKVYLQNKNTNSKNLLKVFEISIFKLFHHHRSKQIEFLITQEASFFLKTFYSCHGLIENMPCIVSRYLPVQCDTLQHRSFLITLQRCFSQYLFTNPENTNEITIVETFLDCLSQRLKNSLPEIDVLFLIACQRGHQQTLSFLLKNGANPLCKNGNNKMGFTYLLERGSLDIAYPLIKKHISMIHPEDKLKLFYLACQKGCEPIVAILLQSGLPKLNFF